jgi:Xaa-Pro aminopeptidase
LGSGIGLDLRQAPYLVPGDATALASGMTLAVRTRLQSERLGTIHRTDTILVAETGPDVLTAPGSRA